MIARLGIKIVSEAILKKKVVLLFGARQTGKTTLLKNMAANSNHFIWLNADEYDIQQQFINPTSTGLKAIIGQSKLVIIDEAQRIENIGICLKLLYDTFPDIQVIATGSSAFELKNKTSEPLTGRKIELQLFPLSFQEMVNHHGLLIEKRLLKTRLIYGYYPEVVVDQGNKKEVLKFLSDSYLYKDILMLDSVKKPEKLVQLLQTLALQIGSEVSYNEIGNHIGLDSKTVETYINLLEKSFVIFKLSSLNRNVRNELKLSKKIYFYDNGIRNAIISNFQPIETRLDNGALFENFVISERIKFNHYNKLKPNIYFWRTKSQQEIDYIEDIDGTLHAFEFKFNPLKKASFPKTFTDNYKNSETVIINFDNLEQFLLK